MLQLAHHFLVSTTLLERRVVWNCNLLSCLTCWPLISLLVESEPWRMGVRKQFLGRNLSKELVLNWTIRSNHHGGFVWRYVVYVICFVSIYVFFQHWESNIPLTWFVSLYCDIHFLIDFSKASFRDLRPAGVIQLWFILHDAPPWDPFSEWSRRKAAQNLWYTQERKT